MSVPRPLRAEREDRYLARRAAMTSWRLRRRFKELEAFCLFVGYPRSGHSLVGALIDAHPEAVIAHELDVLGFLEQGETRRERLLSLCIERNRWFTKRRAQWAEFSYRVEKGWQGRCRRYRIIGDKKGGRTTLRLRKNPELLKQLQASLGVPLRLIHVVRHPLDNISTMCTRRDEPLDATIETYFERAEFLREYLRRVPREDVMYIEYEAFIRRPEAFLRMLSGFLGLTADEAWMTRAGSVVNREPSRSRTRVEWSPAQISTVRERAAEVPALSRYDDWTHNAI